MQGQRRVLRQHRGGDGQGGPSQVIGVADDLFGGVVHPQHQVVVQGPRARMAADLHGDENGKPSIAPQSKARGTAGGAELGGGGGEARSGHTISRMAGPRKVSLLWDFETVRADLAEEHGHDVLGPLLATRLVSLHRREAAWSTSAWRVERVRWLPSITRGTIE